MSSNQEESTMNEKEKTMERLKYRLLKIQEKIQDRVEDFQDHVQSKIENSKLSRFVSHLSEDKTSVESGSIGETAKDVDDKISTGSDNVFKEVNSNNIPSVIIDEPIDINKDPKDLCIDFIKIEKNAVLYKRRSLSASNLSYDNDSTYDSSSDSCFSSRKSSGEERPTEFRSRSGSLPPGQQLDLITTSASAFTTCTDLIEKLGNRFPRLKSRGDRFQRV